MFIIEVIVGGGGVLECIILKSVPNILSTPLTYMRMAKYNALQYTTTTTHYNLNNKHKVELSPF